LRLIARPDEQHARCATAVGLAHELTVLAMGECPGSSDLVIRLEAELGTLKATVARICAELGISGTRE
jgi:hypothetical protein